MDKNTAEKIIGLAEKYETSAFLTDDPSRFMHMVKGDLNREAMAFVASCLSYGSRKQFFPKIQYMLECSGGEMHRWIESGDFIHDIPDNDKCYYRLYKYRDMNRLLTAYRDMMLSHGSMKNYIHSGAANGIEAVEALCGYFSGKGISTVVPKNTTSACKRLCMFLRWMVRDNSPVDLGIWADIIDKRSLIMPLDTHVVKESVRLGLLDSTAASMSAARKLTNVMLRIFPDDPLKGDFALFGYGVSKEKDI